MDKTSIYKSGEILSLRTPAKKSLAALALLVPLTLAACGSDSEDTAASKSTSAAKATSAAATSTPASENASASPSEDKDAAADAQKDSATPAPAENADQQPTENVVNPIENIEQTTFQPLPEGQDDPAVKAEIERIVSGLYAEQRFKPAMEYTLNNSCESIASQFRAQMQSGANGQQWSQIPDSLTYKEIFEAQAAANGQPQTFPGMPTLASVTDVKVNGDQASATINITNPDGTGEGNTMIFAKEGGAWKMCSPANSPAQ